MIPAMSELPRIIQDLEQSRISVKQLIAENVMLQAMNTAHIEHGLTFRVDALETPGKTLDNAQWSVKLLFTKLTYGQKEAMCSWLRYALDTATSLFNTAKTEKLTAQAKAYRLAQATDSTVDPNQPCFGGAPRRAPVKPDAHIPTLAELDI